MICPKNTHLVEDVEYRVLASSQISLNLMQRLQRSRTCLRQSETRAAILIFRSAQNTSLVEGVEILHPTKFRWIPFSGFREEVENISANQSPVRPHWFSCRSEKQKTWWRMLRSCFLSSFVEFHSVVSEKRSKMSQSIRGQGGNLCFPIGPKNTNLVEDVEILLPLKVRWIPFSGFRGEVERVSADQRLVPSSWFYDRFEKHKLGFPIVPKNTNLVEDVEILLPVKFRWIPFSGFKEEENVSTNHRPGRLFWFSDRPEKKNKLGRGRWDLASCQV